MKAQYLAVESVLTFGLGLMAAIGIITTFDSYSNGVYDTSEKVEARMVSEEVIDNVNSLRPVQGEAYRDLELPEDISNRDYRVVLGENITVEVGEESYETRMPLNENFEGSGSGEVRLYREPDGFELVDA
ncbi:MAG: hypothetical protein ACLFTA_00195 [Candidatus Nanohaloarchaea archaeon]